MVSNRQVAMLRKYMAEGLTQEAAAAKVGMSVRTARAWKDGPLPSETRAPRDWRTRADPFEGVWEALLEPLLLADTDRQLEAPTLLDVITEKHPGRFSRKHLRSLQRRLHAWRAQHGGPRRVMFPQDHPPGVNAAFDFTHATELGVTIGGVLLAHLFFVFTLPFSGWTFVQLAFGETFEAMLAGIQGALWALGGIPKRLRSDNLSAATHALAEGGRGLTRRYQHLLTHYDLSSSRIKPGESHENGSVETRHPRLKSALAQALLLRGSKDFNSLAEYCAFVARVVARTFNEGIDEALAEERRHLRPLPDAPIPAYTRYRVRVSRSSLIELGKRFYSVPSRLIREWVEVDVHADHLAVHHGGKLTATMPRIHGAATARVDYRHIIWSLVQKPGAFANYRYREELFPSLIFRRTYDAFTQWHGRGADLAYLRVLHLAASTMESMVAAALDDLLARDEHFTYEAVKARVSPERPALPVVTIDAPDLRAYDQLLTAEAS
jgi:hypothetical protein